MPDDHVTRAYYEAVERGDLPPEALNHRIAQHLLDLCPICRHEYRSYLESRPPRSVPGELATVILLEAYRLIEHRLRELDRQAKRDFLELLNLPPERRKERISRATRRFRNPLLAEQLLDASSHRKLSQPEEALAFAQLAFQVAMRSSVLVAGVDPAHELMLRALAHEANALRTLGDLPRADNAIKPALQKIDELRDPLSRAEICNLGASLRRDQRRFQEGLQLAERSVSLFLAAEQRVPAAESLILQANILSDMGRLERAVEIDHEVLRLLNAATEPRLFLCTQHNLACRLERMGDPGAARRHLQANDRLYAAFKDRWTQLRRRWLEGKIAHGLGEWEEAERALVEVRDGFIRRNNGYDAALVSLDLALLYADLGRSAEMQQLAREMMPIFRAQEVHREALAALLVFWEAANRQAVTPAMVESLTSYLRQARRDPSFRYEPAP